MPTRETKQMEKARAFETEYLKPFKAGVKKGGNAQIAQRAHAQMGRTAMNAQRESMGLPPLPKLVGDYHQKRGKGFKY